MAGPGLTIAIHCFPAFVNPKISIDIPCVQLPFLLAHTSENQHVTGRIVTSNIGQSSSMIFHVGLGVCIHLGYILMSMAFCCSMGRCVSPHPWGCHWTSPTSLAKSQPCAGHWIAGQHWSNTVRVSKLLIAKQRACWTCTGTMPDPGFGLPAPGTGQRLPNHRGPNAEGPSAARPRRFAPLHGPLLRHTNQRSLRSLASEQL